MPSGLPFLSLEKSFATFPNRLVRFFDSFRTFGA